MYVYFAPAINHRCFKKETRKLWFTPLIICFPSVIRPLTNQSHTHHTQIHEVQQRWNKVDLNDQSNPFNTFFLETHLIEKVLQVHLSDLPGDLSPILLLPSLSPCNDILIIVDCIICRPSVLVLVFVFAHRSYSCTDRINLAGAETNYYESVTTC